NVNDQYGSIALPDAGFYKFRFGFAEGGGGDWGRVLWDLGGGYQIIDGGSDTDSTANFFVNLTTTPSNVGGNVAVKGNSTVNVDGIAEMGAFTLHGGSTLNIRKVGPTVRDAPLGLASSGTTLDDTTLGTATVDVASDMPFQGGALTLGTINNTLTKTGDGAATFTTVTHPVNGGAFILNANAGDLAITGRMGDDSNSIALAASVAGGAQLSITEPTNNLTGTATVNGGRLVIGGSEGQSALGSSLIVLNGGDLDLNTSPNAVYGDGLVRKRFDQYDGGGFPVDRWALMAAATPTEQVIDTRIDYSAGLDGYTVTWEGYIYVPAAGTYMFQGGSDDEGYLEIDGGSGTWTTLTHTNNSTQNGQIDLAGEGLYKFRFGYAEGNGGDWGVVRWDLGGGYQVIDGGSDTDTATNFFYLVGSAPPYLGNDVDAHASTTINTDIGAILGTLSIDNGVTLTANISRADGGLAFEETVFTNVGTGDVEFVTNGEARLGRLDDGGNTISMVLSGLAFVFDDSTSNAATTTLRVDSGTVVIVGEAGGADPLGGAVLVMMADPSSIIVSSKGGDADIDTNITMNEDTALTVKRAYTGTETGVKVSLTGAIEIADDAVLALATEDGYTLSINTTPTGVGGGIAGSITVADDSLGEIGTGGSTANIPLLSIGARTRFNITTDTALDEDTVVNIGADSYFDIQIGQQDTYFPEFHVGSFGILGGDLTGADFGSGGNQNVYLSEDSVLVVDPDTAAFNPTREEMSDKSILWLGVVDLADVYTNLGDGTTSVYKGVIFSNEWTAPGDFASTLSEGTDASGFGVDLRRNQRFVLGATFDAATGNEVLITGDTKMTIATPLAGTADTFIRRGTAPSPGNPGGLGRETLEFVTTANLVAGVRTMTLENGGMLIDQANDMRRAVNNDSTMNIGSYATLVLNDSIQTGQWNIQENAYVWSNWWGRMVAEKDPLASVNFENGSTFMFAYGEFRHVEHGLPLNKSVNIIVNDGWLGYQEANQIRLGDGAFLATPYNRSHTLNDRSGDRDGTGPSPSGGVFLTDPDGTELDGPTVNSVRIGKANGGELVFELELDLRNNLANGDDSRATLYVGAAPGTEPWLPPDNPPGGGGDATRDWANWAQNPMSGSVVIRSGRAVGDDLVTPQNNWGKGSIIAGDIIIESGTFRLGDNWNQRGDIDVDINGEIITKNGGNFFMTQRPATPMNQLVAGTLGTAHILENGGRADYQLWSTDPGFLTI
ncbi:MAG: hypothetical protein IMZ55_15265, partial [Acidobacteria bacterium]|nr:hypothetical protein [Acidobacteriota bacterium]